MANKLVENIERGARELETPQGTFPSHPAESKFKNHAIDAALTISLLSSSGKTSKGLQQFSAKNISQHQRNDKASEKSEAKVRKRAFKAEDSQHIAVADKKELLSERSEIIKSEYGSIKGYNIAKQSPDFIKSERLKEVEFKVAKADGVIRDKGNKVRKLSARAENIRTERSENRSFHVSEKSNKKLVKAEKKINHRIIRKSYKFDSVNGKINKSLTLEKSIKPLDGRGGIVTKGLKGAGAITAVRLSASIHGQLTKHGSGTDSEKAFNTGIRAIEHGAVKATKHAHKFLKERPYKRVSKLQLKSDKANAKLYAKRKGGSAKQMKKHAKQYMNKAKQARKAMTTGEKVGKAIKAVAMAVKKLLFNPVVLKVLLVAALVVLIVSMIMSLILAVANDGMNIMGAFLTDDENIYAAQNHANAHAKTTVTNVINNLINNTTAEEVWLNSFTVGHNPYSLISFLSAYSLHLSGDEYDNSFVFTDNHIRQATERFINTMYTVTHSTFNDERFE